MALDPSPDQIAAGRTVLLAADLAHVFWSQDAAAADEIVRMVFEAMTAAAPTANAAVMVFTEASDTTDIARDIAPMLQRYQFVKSRGEANPESPPIGSDAAADWQRDVADPIMQKSLMFYLTKKPGESREDFDKRRMSHIIVSALGGE